VRVAVIDSGVNLNHTDLQGTNIETGYNFVDNNTDVTDEINHGTGVLGVMGAVTNNGKGVSGIAPNATYVPLKFLDSSGAGSLSDMISAMYAAVDTYNCKIINMSVGVILETEMEVLNSAVNYVTKKGAIIVCACGNYGTNVYCYPASCKNTISVGSATSGYALQSYSQRNDKVDVVTQSGFYVLSKTGGYKSGSGTSFSSPIIAGVAAILASKYPNMTYTDFENVIKAATMDILDSGKDYAGYGFFKALSAVDFLESDSEVFVSPIYKNGTTMNLKMFTSKDFSTGKAVLSYFKDNRFTTSEITDITASDGVYFKSVSVDENSDELHIFAIKDILNLRGISDTNILKY
jgi:subtilisin family serine protease